MGSIGGKSLVFRPVERSGDDDRGHLRSSGSRERGCRPRRVEAPLEEAEYGRAAARHIRVGGAFGTKRANETRDLRMPCRNRRFEIIAERLTVV